MIPVVIDTNVIVAALLTKKPDAKTLKVVEAALRGRILPLHSPEIAAEYRDVLGREEFASDPAAVESVLAGIRGNGRAIEPASSGEPFPDPTDRVFYCVALAMQPAGAKLVTGNKRHHPHADFVVSPAELCDLLGL